MLGRICMTLAPQDIICAVTEDPKIKIKYIPKKNIGLKYGELIKNYIGALVWSSDGTEDMLWGSSCWKGVASSYLSFGGFDR